MAKEEDGATQEAYSNPDQQSGYWDDNSKITYWDSATQSYKTVDTNQDDIFGQKADLGLKFYENTEGDYVYGTEPESKYIPTDTREGGRYDDGIYVEGVNPFQPAPFDGGGLSLGGPQEGQDQGGNTQPPVAQPPPPPPPPPDPNTPYDPDTGVGDPNNPTDDWFWTDPVGYENAPQPEGDGSFAPGGPPADTSWDWGHFREKAPGDRQWGGYDQDYQAFERYQPGMRSPWGMPNIEGGNRDFYQQQFVNQLRDEQGYRNRQRGAQERRQFAAENPITPPPTDWSWANGGQGLPDVQMGGAAPTVNWDLNQSFTPGESTNADILRWATTAEGFGADDRKWYSEHLNNPQYTGGDSTSWSSAGDPSKLISRLPTDGGTLTQRNQRRMSDLFNAMYNRGDAAPYAPAGYASPINAAPGG